MGAKTIWAGAGLWNSKPEEVEPQEDNRIERKLSKAHYLIEVTNQKRNNKKKNFPFMIKQEKRWRKGNKPQTDKNNIKTSTYLIFPLYILFPFFFVSIDVHLPRRKKSKGKNTIEKKKRGKREIARPSLKIQVGTDINQSLIRGAW